MKAFQPLLPVVVLALVALLVAGCGASLPGFEFGGNAQPTVGGNNQNNQADDEERDSGEPDASGDQTQNQSKAEADKPSEKPSTALAYTQVGATDLAQPILRLAANPQVKRVYALQGNRGPLAVLDASGGQLISTLQIGPTPTDVAVEPVNNRIYVTDLTDGLRVIDGVSQGVARQIGIPGARAVAADRGAGRLYVLQSATPSSPERVRVFDLNSYADQGAITGDPGYTLVTTDLAVDDTAHRVYVARTPRAAGPAQIAVYDGLTRALVGTINVPGEAGEMVAVPEGSRLYAAIVGRDRGVAVIDTTKNAVAAFIRSAVGGPFLAVRGTRAYTSGPGVNVQVFDLALRRWLGEHPASGDLIALPGADRLLVGGRGLVVVAEVAAKDVNPSFESDENNDGIPDGWTGAGLGDKDRLATEKVLDGAKAAALTGGGSKSLRQVLGLAGKKGERLSLMAWAHPKDAAGDAQVKAVVRYTNGQTDTITLAFSARPEAWQVKAANLVAKEAFDRVTVTLEYAGASGTFWFDYVLLGAPASGEAKVIEDK